MFINLYLIVFGLSSSAGATVIKKKTNVEMKVFPSTKEEGYTGRYSSNPGGHLIKKRSPKILSILGKILTSLGKVWSTSGPVVKTGGKVWKKLGKINPIFPIGGG